MRILVMGAGAVGGYFGGRLAQSGRDVTFLVRPGRAARLAETGLVIQSRFGDLALKSPAVALAPELRDAFDVVLLTCKSYDLESAMEAITPAVGPETMIVPLLNGMRHLDVLDARFGSERVLGGTCFISARLDDAGRIVHLNDVHRLSFGARCEGQSERVEAIAGMMSDVSFEWRVCDDIVLEMWEKWVFLATLAGATCLARASIGDIIASGGIDLIKSLADECRSIAAATGRAPRAEPWNWSLGHLTAADSTMTASILGDLEQGRRTEADHILGDLLRRGGESPNGDRSLLRIAYTAIKAAEARQARETH